MNSWDVLRVLVIVLFGLTVGETAWIMRLYFGILVKTRRLLPLHVVLISASLLGLEAEAVWQNAVRFREGFSPYVVINLVLFIVALTSLHLIRIHISRKRDVAKVIVPLLQDPHDMP